MQHHSLVSYGLYTVGFVLFVTSLKARALAGCAASRACGGWAWLTPNAPPSPLQKKWYLYQFGQFAWTHMILLVILMQARAQRSGGRCQRR